MKRSNIFLLISAFSLLAVTSCKKSSSSSSPAAPSTANLLSNSCASSAAASAQSLDLAIGANDTGPLPVAASDLYLGDGDVQVTVNNYTSQLNTLNITYDFKDLPGFIAWKSCSVATLNNCGSWHQDSRGFVESADSPSGNVMLTVKRCVNSLSEVVPADVSKFSATCNSQDSNPDNWCCTSQQKVIVVSLGDNSQAPQAAQSCINNLSNYQTQYTTLAQSMKDSSTKLLSSLNISSRSQAQSNANPTALSAWNIAHYETANLALIIETTSDSLPSFIQMMQQDVASNGPLGLLDATSSCSTASVGTTIDNSASLPNTSSSLPNTSSSIPNTSSSLPNTSASIPNTSTSVSTNTGTGGTQTYVVTQTTTATNTNGLHFSLIIGIPAIIIGTLMMAQIVTTHTLGFSIHDLLPDITIPVFGYKLKGYSSDLLTMQDSQRQLLPLLQKAPGDITDIDRANFLKQKARLTNASDSLNNKIMEMNTESQAQINQANKMGEKQSLYVGTTLKEKLAKAATLDSLSTAAKADLIASLTPGVLSTAGLAKINDIDGQIKVASTSYGDSLTADLRVKLASTDLDDQALLKRYEIKSADDISKLSTAEKEDLLGKMNDTTKFQELEKGYKAQLETLAQQKIAINDADVKPQTLRDTYFSPPGKDDIMVEAHAKPGIGSLLGGLGMVLIGSLATAYGSNLVDTASDYINSYTTGMDQIWSQAVATKNQQLIDVSSCYTIINNQ